jgi:hypothetical protein
MQAGCRPTELQQLSRMALPAPGHKVHAPPRAAARLVVRAAATRCPHAAYTEPSSVAPGQCLNAKSGGQPLTANVAGWFRARPATPPSHMATPLPQPRQHGRVPGSIPHNRTPQDPTSDPTSCMETPVPSATKQSRPVRLPQKPSKRSWPVPAPRAAPHLTCRCRRARRASCPRARPTGTGPGRKGPPPLGPSQTAAAASMVCQQQQQQTWGASYNSTGRQKKKLGIGVLQAGSGMRRHAPESQNRIKCRGGKERVGPAAGCCSRQGTAGNPSRDQPGACSC